MTYRSVLALALLLQGSNSFALRRLQPVRTFYYQR